MSKLINILSMVGSVTPLTAVLALIWAMAADYIPTDHQLVYAAVTVVLGVKLINIIPAEKIAEMMNKDLMDEINQDKKDKP